MKISFVIVIVVNYILGSDQKIYTKLFLLNISGFMYASKKGLFLRQKFCPEAQSIAPLEKVGTLTMSLNFIRIRVYNKVLKIFY